MEEDFKRLAGQVARALNLSEQTVADFAKSDEAIKGLGTAFKDFRTETDTAGYQRGEERTKRQAEKVLKARGVEAPDLDKLDDSLDKLAAAGAGKGIEQLSAEEVAKLPQVRKLLTDADNARMQAVEEAGRKAADGLKAEREAFAREQLHARVEQQARTLIVGLNPNLNADPAKADRQVKRLLDELKSGDYKVEGDGTLSPVDADGKYLDNGGGGRKSFAELVRETVTAEYDLPASKPREGTALKPGDVAHGSSDYTGPKTQADYEAALNKTAPGSAERTKLIADFKSYKETQQPAT